MHETQSRALTVSLFSPAARAQLPVPGPRLMPRIGVIESEAFWKRSLFVLLAIAFLWGYSYVLQCYWAPAHPGINQNGYLVSGKNLAESGSTGIEVKDGYKYLGWMWNIVDDDLKLGKWMFYPKYPLGTGALFAACLKASIWATGDWEAGKIWTFYVNPVGVVLALAAMFMLLRQYTGSFIALLGTMILACCQVLLSFAEQPLSHGPALCMVTWGMYFLLRWWQTESIWRGILAGLCLGYAVTIRYTEGLLLIPMAAVLISMVRYDLRNTRWWSMGIWLAIAIVAIQLRAYSTLPLEQFSYKTYIVFGFVALALAAAPLLFERNLIEDMASSVTTISRKQRWGIFAIHVLRTIVAGILVWKAIYHDEPVARGSGADVDRMVKLIGIKTALIGAAAMLYLIPWSQPRRYLRLAVPVVAWLIPVGILVSYNYLTVHSFSGYDSTNESTAFTWRTFADKWDDTIQQIYDYSMWLIPPLSLAGIFIMFRWNWRAALLTTLWLVPGLLLYIAYYYGKQRPGMWYLRFFLTLFPPMIIAAMWLLKAASDGIRERVSVGRGRGSIAIPLGLGLFTFCSCAVGLQISLPPMERELASNWNLAFSCDQIKLAVKRLPKVFVNDKPAGKPLVFAEGRGNINGPMCNFLQFAGDFELYPFDGFFGNTLGGFRDGDSQAPNPLQAKRTEWLAKWFRGKSEADIIKDQNKIMQDALDEGRYVLAVLQPGSGTSMFKNRFVTAGFDLKPITQWREPARVSMERSTGPLDPLSRGMPLYPSRASQTWGVYQITKKPKPPATKPTVAATNPTTSPTTKPTLEAKNPATAPATKPTQLTAGPATKPAEQLQAKAPATQPGTSFPRTIFGIPLNRPAAAKQAGPATAPTTSPTTAPSK